MDRRWFGPVGPAKRLGSGAEELAAPEIGGAGHSPGAREKNTGRVLDVLVEPVPAGEVQLHGYELLAWVALVGDEEQAGVEPPEPVGAVDEVVSAPQQLRAVVVVRVGQPDVRGQRYHRFTVTADGLEVDRVELVLRPERRAFALVPAEDGLLLAQRGAVPGLDDHPDPPGDQIGTADHPLWTVPGLGPHVVAQDVRAVFGLDVAGTVLEPHQVARSGLGS